MPQHTLKPTTDVNNCNIQAELEKNIGEHQSAEKERENPEAVSSIETMQDVGEMFENPSTKRVSQNTQAKVKPKITGCTKVDINITRRSFIDIMSKTVKK